MKYGLHTALVDEVIEFVKSGKILNPTIASSSNSRWSVVDSFEVATRSACDETFGDEDLLWKDIREREMSTVKGKAYQIDGFKEYRDNLSGLLKTFTMYLKRQLPEDFSDVLDDAIGDLYNCAFNRCVNGAASSFFESVFEAYKSGCWPCGWDGDYPTGRMRVFRPTPATVDREQ